MKSRPVAFAPARCLALAFVLCAFAVQAAAGPAAIGPAGAAPAAEGNDTSSDGGEKPRVSRGQAVLLSLLLPGLGQSMSGHHGRAKIFYGAEAVIWTTAGSYRVVGNMRMDDVEEFARVRGNADPNDTSDHYFQLLSDFSSNDVYNIAVRDEARAIYPDDRDQQLLFIAANSIQGDHGWRWPDFASRREFQLLRHDALSAKRTSVLVTGWAVVNRLVSAIEAARSYPRDSGQANSGDGPMGGFAIQAGVGSHEGEPSATLGLVHGF